MVQTSKRERGALIPFERACFFPCDLSPPDAVGEHPLFDRVCWSDSAQPKMKNATWQLWQPLSHARARPRAERLTVSHGEPCVLRHLHEVLVVVVEGTFVAKVRLIWTCAGLRRNNTTGSLFCCTTGCSKCSHAGCAPDRTTCTSSTLHTADPSAWADTDDMLACAGEPAFTLRLWTALGTHAAIQTLG